jgi:hypothetical protein
MCLLVLSKKGRNSMYRSLALSTTALLLVMVGFVGFLQSEGFSTSPSWTAGVPAKVRGGVCYVEADYSGFCKANQGQCFTYPCVAMGGMQMCMTTITRTSNGQPVHDPCLQQATGRTQCTPVNWPCGFNYTCSPTCNGPLPDGSFNCMNGGSALYTELEYLPDGDDCY